MCSPSTFPPLKLPRTSMSEASYLYSLMGDVLTFLPPTPTNYNRVQGLLSTIEEEGRAEGFDTILFPPCHWEGASSWSLVTKDVNMGTDPHHVYWECPGSGGVDPRRSKRGSSSLSLQGRAMLWEELCSMVDVRATGRYAASESFTLVLRGVLLGGIPPPMEERRLDVITFLSLRKLSPPQSRTQNDATASSRALFQTIAALPRLAKLCLDSCDQEVVEGLAFVWCGCERPFDSPLSAGFNKGAQSTLEWLEVVCNKRLVDTTIQTASILAAATHVSTLVYLSFQFPTLTSYNSAPPALGDMRWNSDNELRTINLAAWLYSDLGLFFGHLLNDRLEARFPSLGQLSIDCAPLLRSVLPVKALRTAAAAAGRPSPVNMQRLSLLHLSLKFAGVSSADVRDSPRLEGMELVAACAPNLTSLVLYRARFTALAYGCMKALASLVMFGPSSATADSLLNSKELLALAKSCGGTLNRLRLHHGGEVENMSVLCPPLTDGDTPPMDHFSVLSELVVEDTDIVVHGLLPPQGSHPSSLSTLKRLEIRRIPSHDLSDLLLPPSCTHLEELHLSYLLPTALRRTPPQPCLTQLTLDHTSFSDGVIQCIPIVCPALESLTVHHDRTTDVPAPVVGTLHPLSTIITLSRLSLRKVTLCGSQPTMFQLGGGMTNLTLDDITFADSTPSEVVVMGAGEAERWGSLGSHAFARIGDTLGASVTHLRLDGLFPLETKEPVSFVCAETGGPQTTTSILRLFVHLRDLSLSLDGGSLGVGGVRVPIRVLPDLPPSLESVDVKLARDMAGLWGLRGCWRLRELTLFMCPLLTDASFTELFVNKEGSNYSPHLLAAGWRRHLAGITIAECGVKDLGAGVLAYLHYHPTEQQICLPPAGPVRGMREVVVQGGGGFSYAVPLGCYASKPPPVALQTLSLTNCEEGFVLASIGAIPTAVSSITLSPLPDNVTALDVVEALVRRGDGEKLRELNLFRGPLHPLDGDGATTTTIDKRWQEALLHFSNLSTLEMSDTSLSFDFGLVVGDAQPLPRILAVSTDRFV